MKLLPDKETWKDIGYLCGIVIMGSVLLLVLLLVIRHQAQVEKEDRIRLEDTIDKHVKPLERRIEELEKGRK